jgi:LmbE family N-acetylglucosaminyl deacetylase
MSTATDPGPRTVLAVATHEDDPAVTAAAAKLTADGGQVHVLVLANLDRLAHIAAARRFDSGTIRRLIVGQIRRLQPDVVVCSDGTYAHYCRRVGTVIVLSGQSEA